MKKQHIEAVIKRHSDLLELGDGPIALGDGGGHSRSRVRYAAMAEQIIKEPYSSVLDIGCGFADLYGFLTENGWSGSYVGVDLVGDFVQRAQANYPAAEIHKLDDMESLMDLGEFDFVIAVSIFNLKFEDEQNKSHIEDMIKRMFALCKRACIFDFMTTNVDFKSPIGWHTDPLWALQLAQKHTRRVSFSADYMPYEFCITCFKDQEKTERNVYKEFLARSEKDQNLKISKNVTS